MSQTAPIPAEALRLRATELGFDWFGAAPAAPLAQELAHLREWIAEGRHGDMDWLARDPERRADPELVLPGCKTVIVLGMNYLREESVPASHTTHATGRISKYARTRDYHRVIEKRLRRLARHISTELAPGAKTRALVDYGPVMERPWAARAGIGFIGKHTLLIHPRDGSFHFLACLLTTAELDNPGPPPELPPAGCGDCRRCIDACPTAAITEPWKLDANRCLSYLTIEKKGPINEELWDRFSGYIFGCDICQDVCPYNQSRARPTTDSPLGPPIVPAQIPLAELIRDARGFLDRLGPASSPLRRAGQESLTRNAIIVAANSTTPDAEAGSAMRAVADDHDRPAWLRDLAARVIQRGQGASHS